MCVKNKAYAFKRLLFYLACVFSMTIVMAQNVDMQHSINVTGQGVVYVDPDIATLRFGITTSHPILDEAVDKANTVIADVLAILDEFAIEGKDIKTGQFSITPQQPYNRNGVPEEILGYLVNHTLIITVRDIDKVGDILIQSINAGVNNSNNITYSISDVESVRDEARALAVESAQKKAQQLADLTGATLGKVLRVDETNAYLGNTGGNGYSAGLMGPQGPAGPQGPVPVSAGQTAIQVNLFIIYEIK